MDISDRVVFDHESQIMDVDFSNITFESSGQVDDIYDQIAELLKRTKQQWYFLIDYQNCQIHFEALIAWENRGKRLNLGYSLGSVRYHASEAAQAELVRRATDDRYYANLANSRGEALQQVLTMKEQMHEKQEQALADEAKEAKARKWQKMLRDASIPEAYFDARVRFLAETQTMEVDFSDFDFVNPKIVDVFYDHIETRLRQTGHKWYFLVNYHKCRVQLEAWMQYERRGKAVNIEFSLGTVRFDPSEQTAAEIERRANTESFDANLFSTREGAVKRIAEMRMN